MIQNKNENSWLREPSGASQGDNIFIITKTHCNESTEIFHKVRSDAWGLHSWIKFWYGNCLIFSHNLWHRVSNTYSNWKNEMHSQYYDKNYMLRKILFQIKTGKPNQIGLSSLTILDGDLEI